MLHRAQVVLTQRRLYPRKPLHGHVAHEIGRQIVAGTIGEGDFLPRETELSKQFAVSRQAVREALKVLAAKGLLNSRRRAGTYVLPRSAWNLLDPDVLAWHPPANLTPDFFNDLLEIRRLIEPAAAEYAARRGEPLHIARLTAALDAMRLGVGSPADYLAADSEFHLALFAASGNSLIERLGNIVRPLLEASFRAQEEIYPELSMSLFQHNVLLDAITRGDGPAARQAMEDILDVASDALTDFVSLQQEPSA